MIKKKSVSDYKDVINPDKFWSWVDKNAADGCWEWTGGLNTTGYGLFSLRSLPDDYERTGRTMTQLLAHRVAFFLDRGYIGNDDVNNHVLHKCDNRKCCNPAHLFSGTIFDNVRDMRRKRYHGYCELNSDVGV